MPTHRRTVAGGKYTRKRRGSFRAKTARRSRGKHRRSASRRRSSGSQSRGNHKQRPRWITAISAAQKSLTKTGSLKKARKTLRKQALMNAKKLFGHDTVR